MKSPTAHAIASAGGCLETARLPSGEDEKSTRRGLLAFLLCIDKESLSVSTHDIPVIDGLRDRSYFILFHALLDPTRHKKAWVSSSVPVYRYLGT